MKKLLLLISMLALTSLVFAEEHGTKHSEGKYTSTISYVIHGPGGAEADRLEHRLGIPLPWVEAQALKYVRMLRCFGGDTNLFLEVATQSGTLKQFLLQELSEQQAQ